MLKHLEKRDFFCVSESKVQYQLKCLRIENVLRLGEFHDGGIIIKGTIM